MLPVLVIVGRPNVGKSTLFNCLTKTRDAIVADSPGVTRDRQYGQGQWNGHQFVVVDTGGLGTELPSDIAHFSEQQVLEAITEARFVLLVVDARSGLIPADLDMAKRLRAHAQKVAVVVNKSEGMTHEQASNEFYQLGFASIFTISAAHQRGIQRLLEALLHPIESTELALPLEETTHSYAHDESAIRIAVIGRPNVGKSTLVNSILGQERVLVRDEPGTTKDSIMLPFIREEQHYTLIDTAGIRRRARITDKVEKFSVIKALEALGYAEVAVIVVDATLGITEQDLRLLGMVVDLGKGLVIAINKWDQLHQNQRLLVKENIKRRLPFVSYARQYCLSALKGTGIAKLFRAINEAHASSSAKLSTAELTRALALAIKHHPPPLVHGRRIRLRYAHVGRHQPLTVIVHGKQTTAVPGHYLRYLTRFFREHFKLMGVPLLVQLKQDTNPYVD